MFKELCGVLILQYLILQFYFCNIYCKEMQLAQINSSAAFGVFCSVLKQTPRALTLQLLNFSDIFIHGLFL